MNNMKAYSVRYNDGHGCLCTYKGYDFKPLKFTEDEAIEKAKELATRHSYTKIYKGRKPVYMITVDNIKKVDE